MTKEIPFLVPGDKIKIVSPAKGIEPALVFEAKDFWESHGFIVELGEYCIDKFHYFSGTDQERCSDFQDALDDPEIKAIICSRGGYGSIRILDLLNWSSFLRQPKWILGFSDITVFHQRAQRFGTQSIHAAMPLNYKQITPEASRSMLDSLTGKLKGYTIKVNARNCSGKARGKLIGGNLSILYSLIGTDDQVDYKGSILFLEEVSEQLYHIDRMFYAFQKARILNQISALVIGGFTELKDTEHGFGKSVEEIILDHCAYRNIPIVFGFPAGHINDNRALIFGAEVELCVEEKEVSLNYVS